MKKLCALAILLCLLGSSVFAAFSDPIFATQAGRTRSDTGTPPGSVNNHDTNKLTVRSTEGFGQKSWIRFDLSTANKIGLRGAKLTLTLMEAKYDACNLDISALNDSCHDNDAWTDTNITWNNAPGNYNTVEGDITDWAALAPAKTTYLSTLSFATGAIGQSFSIDVTSAVLADTDNNVQFILHNSNANINFATWDHSTLTHPYLTLEYTPNGADYPNPAIASKVSTSLSSLSWVTPDPNHTNTVYCDVYLGTEPNRPQMNKKTLGANVTTVAINTANFPTFGTLVNNTTYYWFVDVHDSSRTDNPALGETWSFTTDNNAAPGVNVGLDQILYGLPYTVSLDATVTDDGLPTPPALTYLWERIAGPATAVINTPNAEDTLVTITERGDYQFRLTVSDSAKSTADQLQVVVGTTACDASHLDTGAAYNEADVNHDCIVDVLDLEALIFNVDVWLNCTDTLDNCGN
jgi:hypothetical protein